jgi:hypothetical protein
MQSAADERMGKHDGGLANGKRKRNVHEGIESLREKHRAENVF